MSILTKMASFDDDIDFRRVWRFGLALSAVLVVLSGFGMIGRGFNLGIDFEGGSSWDVPGDELDVDDARAAVEGAGLNVAKVQTLGRGDSRIVRIQSPSSSEEDLRAASDALVEVAGVEASDISVSTVGPSWGDQVSSKAQRALLVFFVLITVYMAVRLEWKMAVGALAAVVHDLVISVGVYALFQIEITPATVIAFLTILGYSLYDTIVVFDRMQTNAAQLVTSSRRSYTDIVSLSLNQVLMRSVNTTVTSLLPVLSILLIGSALMGAVALQEFGLALAIGLLSGAYSSIVVAAPAVAWLKEREPENRERRARARTAQGPIDSPIAARPAATGGSRPSADRPPPALSGRPIPPRPRKKGKKR